MNIITRAHGVTLDDPVREFIATNLASSLGRFEDYVVSVDVFVTDINGPKGGRDKQVRIRVRLVTGCVVATETTRADFYAALKIGAKTCRRAVRRSLTKSQRHDKHTIRRLPAEFSAPT